MDTFDVFITGAGPAGSTLAILLAKSNFSVAIAEKSPFPRRKVCGEYLSPTNLRLLDELNVQGKFLDAAGPEIRRVGLFSSALSISAGMPETRSESQRWGRALRREVLDTMLLKRAKETGVATWQPWSVIEINRHADTHVSKLKSREDGEICEIESKMVVAAHGSWEISDLPTQKRQPVKDSDLLGFKAHFKNTQLQEDLMPMLVFPGGYGGMVTCDEGFVSLSCCIRREKLREIRRKFSDRSLGEAIEGHILESCGGVFEALNKAERAGEWLSAGIIRPGIRSCYKDGIFFVGNAAGESHPIIAEGISMAIQSAAILARCITKESSRSTAELASEQISNDYSRLWLRTFRMRIRVAEFCARAAMSRAARLAMTPIMRAFPSLLTLGAKFAGKLNRRAF